MHGYDLGEAQRFRQAISDPGRPIMLPRPRFLLLALLLCLSGARRAGAQAYSPAFKDMVYATVNGWPLKLDIYLPSTPVNVPVVVWIHGGGWSGGTKTFDTKNPYSTDFTRLVGGGYAVVSIDYRLSSAAQWPAQIYDCKAAVRWIRANATWYRMDPNRIAAWGESAGGHLATMLGVTGDMAAMEGNEGVMGVSSKVQAVVDWYGPMHFLTEGAQEIPNSVIHHDALDSPESLLVGCPIQTCPDKADAASPITYATADDAPILLMHGTMDHFVPSLQSQEMADRLTTAGHKDVTLYFLPNADHGGPPFTDRIPLVQDWLDRHLKTNPPASPYTMIDAIRALRLATGSARANGSDPARLSATATSVNLTDAVRLLRKALGTAPNP